MTDKPKLFSLGLVVFTKGAAGKLTEEDLSTALKRHQSGDWGDMPAEDISINNRALKHGERLVSRYKAGNQAFFVITEWDRSVTTVLLPEEY